MGTKILAWIVVIIVMCMPIVLVIAGIYFGEVSHPRPGLKEKHKQDYEILSSEIDEFYKEQEESKITSNEDLNELSNDS